MGEREGQAQRRPRRCSQRYAARCGRALGFGFSAVLSARVLAHPLAPALLELNEHAAGTVEVAWTTSALRLRGVEFEPALPGHCRPLAEPAILIGDDRVTQRWMVDCSPAGLVGHRVGVDGLAAVRTDVLLRATLADGTSLRAVLRASEPGLTIPARESRIAVTRAYLGLGGEHILTGWDHLLFVLGLLLLAQGVGPLVKTITAFTLGHSVTLSLTVLHAPLLPTRPIEVAIAGSIFVLAVELTRPPQARRSLVHRFPWLIAAVFGLLHGAGFAGALAEIGLPRREIPLALLAFNAGIELGQLVFVAGVLGARRVARAALPRLPPWSKWVPIYALGCFSVYWTLQRLASWVGG
jgi:hypothetical protein